MFQLFEDCPKNNLIIIENQYVLFPLRIMAINLAELYISFSTNNNILEPVLAKL